MLVEFEFCVKSSAVGRHQIHAFNPGHMSVSQQHGYQFRSKALALVFCGHHHIPKHCPVDPITCSTAKTDQIGAMPSTHHCLAPVQHLSQIPETASSRPEAVTVEQAPEILDAQLKPQLQARVLD